MKLKNFAVIKGNGSIIDGTINYQASKPEQIEINDSYNLDLSKYASLTVRSSERFTSGTVEFKIKLKSKRTGVLLILKSQEDTSILCGATLTEHKFAIAEEDEQGRWKVFSVSGSLTNYNIEDIVSFKVQVEGSNIKLLINEVILCERNISIKEAPIEFRICSDQDFDIYDIDATSTKPKIFVIMEFSKEYNELYSDVIKPLVEEFKFECIRGDEFYSGTPILKDITTSIINSKAIIAEITPNNPNVFYEIGYSHAIGKPTILLCDRNRDKLPFDVSGFRTLFYDNTIAGKKKIEDSLRKYFENL